jgi:predicted small secreted protein
MKQLLVILLVAGLSACGTVKGTASGFIDGASKDIKSVGNAGERLANKIKP